MGGAHRPQCDAGPSRLATKAPCNSRICGLRDKEHQIIVIGFRTKIHPIRTSNMEECNKVGLKSKNWMFQVWVVGQTLWVSTTCPQKCAKSENGLISGPESGVTLFYDTAIKLNKPSHDTKINTRKPSLCTTMRTPIAFTAKSHQSALPPTSGAPLPRGGGVPTHMPVCALRRLVSNGTGGGGARSGSRPGSQNRGECGGRKKEV